jgi:hypothetical protein
VDLYSLSGWEGFAAVYSFGETAVLAGALVRKHKSGLRWYGVRIVRESKQTGTQVLAFRLGFRPVRKVRV